MTDKPQSPAVSPNAQICSVCGHANRPGILVCENCGTQIMIAGRPPTPEAAPPQSQSAAPEKPSSQASSASPLPMPAPAQSAPTTSAAPDRPTEPPPSVPKSPPPPASSEKQTAEPPAQPTEQPAAAAPTPAAPSKQPVVSPPPAVAANVPPALTDHPDPSRGTLTFTQEKLAEAKSVTDITDTGDQKVKTPSPTCPNCGHVNRQGILVCENCGTNLLTGEKPRVGTHNFRAQEQGGIATKPLDAPSTEAHLSTEEIRAVTTAGSGVFEEGMALRLEVEGASTPILVYPSHETIIGRRDPVTGSMPDVDMTAYAGYRMGVSRKHVAIRLQDRKLDIRDLGSGNGTFVNGIRLSAHQPHMLRDGDEITLGKMTVRVFFQSKR